MPARAVLFDFGGTLFSYRLLRDRFDALLIDTAHGLRRDASLDDLRRHFAAAMLRATAAFASRPFYLHRELFLEAIAGYLAALGLPFRPEDGSAFYEAQTQLSLPLLTPREGAAETLEALRRRGLHVGIVSNIDDDQFGPFWERIGLAPLVDATTTSEQARSCKPHSGIFRTALEKAGGIAAEETLFVGDSLLHDVGGANAVGMRSVLLSRHPPRVSGPQAPRHVIADLGEILGLLDV